MKTVFFNVSLGIFKVGCMFPLGAGTGLLQGEAKVEICCLEVGQIFACVCVYCTQKLTKFSSMAVLGCMG